MGGRRAPPGRLGERLATADVVHYPLTVPVPAVDAPTVLTLLDVQHLDLPRPFPRGERLFRPLAYDRAARQPTRSSSSASGSRERVVDGSGSTPSAFTRST